MQPIFFVKLETQENNLPFRYHKRKSAHRIESWLIQKEIQLLLALSFIAIGFPISDLGSFLCYSSKDNQNIHSKGKVLMTKAAGTYLVMKLKFTLQRSQVMSYQLPIQTLRRSLQKGHKQLH